MSGVHIKKNGAEKHVWGYWARKSGLGCKELPAQCTALLPSGHWDTDLCNLQRKPLCERAGGDGALLPWGRGRKRWDFPHLIPISPSSQISQSVAGLGRSHTALHSRNSCNPGRAGWGKHMNASPHCRHNKAQNTTQRLLYSRRREGIRKTNTKEAPVLLVTLQSSWVKDEQDQAWILLLLFII